MDIDLDSVWEKYLFLDYSANDSDAAMATVTNDTPTFNLVPTMTGGK